MKNGTMRNMNFRLKSSDFSVATTQSSTAETAKKLEIRIPAPMAAPSTQLEQGICSKVMMILFSVMEAVRSGGDLENIGGNGKYCKDVVCPDGCVIFRLTAKKNWK